MDEEYDMRPIQLPENSVLLRENIRHPLWEKKGPDSHEGKVRYYRYVEADKRGRIHILQKRQNGPDVGAWYPAVILTTEDIDKILDFLKKSTGP
jgi:hypothetical protein